MLTSYLALNISGLKITNLVYQQQAVLGLSASSSTLSSNSQVIFGNLNGELPNTSINLNDGSVVLLSVRMVLIISGSSS